MQQSNRYIVIFSLIVTIVIGGSLAFTSELLGPMQKKSEELDTKKNILGAVLELRPEDDVLKIYNERIESVVVNLEGEQVEKNDKGEAIIAENVVISKEFKKKPEDRLYPIFKFKSAANPNEVEAYILPVFGNGLWDNIWGFVALDTDLNTIKGAVFAHKGETPGLGARITESDVQARYKNKEIYDASGALVSVMMLKGEKNDPSLIDDHHVDGMSGATITGRGVNNMLKNYFGYYEKYLKKLK